MHTFDHQSDLWLFVMIGLVSAIAVLVWYWVRKSQASQQHQSRGPLTNRVNQRINTVLRNHPRIHQWYTWFIDTFGDTSPSSSGTGTSPPSTAPQPQDTHSSHHQTPSNHTTGSQSQHNQSASSQSTGKQSPGNQPGGRRPSGSQSGGNAVGSDPGGDDASGSSGTVVFEQSTCDGCGKTLPADAPLFCPRCGTPIVDDGTVLLCVDGRALKVGYGEPVGREIRRVLVEDGVSELQARKVSRNHLKFKRDQQATYVMDCDSQQGTAVAGKSISPNQWIEIRNGTTITLGDIADLTVYFQD